MTSFLFNLLAILTLAKSNKFLELDIDFFVETGKNSNFSDSSYLNISVGNDGYPVIELHEGLADKVFSVLGIDEEHIPFPG